MASEETQTSQTAEEQKTFTQEEVDALIKKRLACVKSDVPADYEELKSKAQKFDELEEANKTELQKATEQLEKLKSDIAKRLMPDTGIQAYLSVPADTLAEFMVVELTQSGGSKFLRDYSLNIDVWGKDEHARNGLITIKHNCDNHDSNSYVFELLLKDADVGEW